VRDFAIAVAVLLVQIGWTDSPSLLFRITQQLQRLPDDVLSTAILAHINGEYLALPDIDGTPLRLRADTLELLPEDYDVPELVVTIYDLGKIWTRVASVIRPG